MHVLRLFLLIYHSVLSPPGTGYSPAARDPCTGAESEPTPQGNLAAWEGGREGREGERGGREGKEEEGGRGRRRREGGRGRRRVSGYKTRDAVIN